MLPVCVAMWLAGTPAAPEIIYLLTGAYLASDSIMNYTPVSGCVVGAIILTVTPTVTLTLTPGEGERAPTRSGVGRDLRWRRRDLPVHSVGLRV